MDGNITTCCGRRIAVLGILLSVMVTVCELSAQQAASKRKPEEIVAELSVYSNQLRGAMASPEAIQDEQKRAQLAPKLVPPLKKMLPLLAELGEADPEAKEQTMQTRLQFMATLVMLEDAETIKTLETATEGKGPEAAQARATLLVTRWWKTRKDASEQAKILKEARELAMANAQDRTVARTLVALPPQAANKELASQAEKLLDDVRAQQKPKVLEGKPFVMQGVRLDGKPLSTADYKGKVVLVHFWATWARPSVSELPRLKRLYNQWHLKGLEIVGVSCDEKESALREFLAKNKEFAWPQLFDTKNPGWHALAAEYAIEAVPAVFVIDKKGILRSVDAWDKFDNLVGKLMAE